MSNTGDRSAVGVLKTEAEQRGIERFAIVEEALAAYWREQREPS